MSSVVVRDLPDTVHQRLKMEARLHHRSMNREIIAILERETGVMLNEELPPPVKPLVPVDGQSIVEAIRKARDSRR